MLVILKLQKLAPAARRNEMNIAFDSTISSVCQTTGAIGGNERFEME